jgi:UDP-glucose 4-epimerase
VKQAFDGKKVIVTGGAGFIGSALMRQLVEANANVIAVDNLVNGKRENLDGVLGNQARLEVTDIRDRAAMAALIDGAFVVFHLACLGVRHSLHAPEENHAVNATASLDLLTLSREAGTGRFVYVSSSEVYGTAQTAPMDENHATFPHTVYGASKLAGECLARAFHDSYAMDTVVVRPFNAYGPRSHHEGDSGEVIPKFMLRCMTGEPMVVFGDGAQTRDFTYVDDTAAGILLAGCAPEARGQTLNLGSGTEISILELARVIAETVGGGTTHIEHDDPRPGDVLRLYANSERARTLLGFAPEIGFRDGLRRLKEWYEASGVSPESLLRNEMTHNWKPENPSGDDDV